MYIGSLQVFFSFLALAFIGVCTGLLEKNVTCRKVLQLVVLESKPNKQIMACAKAHWDANTQAASPLSPACPRPIFGSYVL